MRNSPGDVEACLEGIINAEAHSEWWHRWRLPSAFSHAASLAKRREQSAAFSEEKPAPQPPHRLSPLLWSTQPGFLITGFSVVELRFPRDITTIVEPHCAEIPTRSSGMSRK
mmetsp:Transcript_45168/g.97486  ORF Transcript_45168/g.97486 Transcript_45168/m.97486 type:complete len:112 (-) Transcript_45168:40-375(-)